MLTTTGQGKYPTDKSEYDNRNIHQIPINCVKTTADLVQIIFIFDQTYLALKLALRVFTEGGPSVISHSCKKYFTIITL